LKSAKVFRKLRTKLPPGGQSIEEFAAGSTASTEIVNGFGIAGEY